MTVTISERSVSVGKVLLLAVTLILVVPTAVANPSIQGGTTISFGGSPSPFPGFTAFERDCLPDLNNLGRSEPAVNEAISKCSVQRAAISMPPDIGSLDMPEPWRVQAYIGRDWSAGGSDIRSPQPGQRLNWSTNLARNSSGSEESTPMTPGDTRLTFQAETEEWPSPASDVIYVTASFKLAYPNDRTSSESHLCASCPAPEIFQADRLAYLGAIYARTRTNRYIFGGKALFK